MDTLTRPGPVDPIDDLIPPPRPRIVRLVIAIVVLALVTCGAIAYGFGYVYPRPDCCGSGSGDAPMSLTRDGQAVMVAAYFFNSSGRELRISDADVDLPGARVLDVGFLDEDTPRVLPYESDPFPGIVGGHEGARIAVTFVPETCDGDPGSWGTATLRLHVVNSWLPSVGRSFELPDPIVDPTQSPLSVFAPANRPTANEASTPLAAACALLGIEG